MKLNIRAFLLAAGLSGAAVTGGVFIVDQEELVLGTYVDPVGIVTECAGQRADGQEPGQPRSLEYCLNQLADNLATYNRQLLRLTDGVNLTEGENAAYLSFIYNVGAEAFRTSTLRKKLLAGDHIGACNELIRWVYSKGRKLNGLVNRRAKELALCLSNLKGNANEPFKPSIGPGYGPVVAHRREFSLRIVDGKRQPGYGRVKSRTVRTAEIPAAA
ncbi:lysozyme [Shewanella algae]|uniref:lysozyme n=1 Tax=Shewanella algae TaxID=38313 RepID=UPI001F2A7198|nr:lysozyme [Shewanella algae]MCE9775595.1 lysozyme [Shewanella algae]